MVQGRPSHMLTMHASGLQLLEASASTAETSRQLCLANGTPGLVPRCPKSIIPLQHPAHPPQVHGCREDVKVMHGPLRPPSPHGMPSASMPHSAWMMSQVPKKTHPRAGVPRCPLSASRLASAGKRHPLNSDPSATHPISNKAYTKNTWNIIELLGWGIPWPPGLLCSKYARQAPPLPTLTLFRGHSVLRCPACWSVLLTFSPTHSCLPRITWLASSDAPLPF